LVYADDVNVLGDNTRIDTIKKNTRTLIDVIKGDGLEVNTEEAKYILLSRHLKAGQNQNTKIANRLFENVENLKYLRTEVATELVPISGHLYQHQEQDRNDNTVGPPFHIPVQPHFDVYEYDSQSLLSCAHLKT
jgi:hypothetical protein